MQHAGLFSPEELSYCRQNALSMTYHLDQARQASSDPLEDPTISFAHVRATLPYQILSVSPNLIISRRRSGRTIAHSSSLAARSSSRCSYITKVESSALRR